MIEERGAKYAIKNWKLPILLGIEQTKRFFVEVAYEGEEDPEERKRKREEAKEAAKEKAEKEKRQEERDRHFLLGEEEQV
jgi:nitrogenase molybdenum-iron protein alpha/beta subunit